MIGPFFATTMPLFLLLEERVEGGLFLGRVFLEELVKLLTIQWGVTARRGRHYPTQWVTTDAWGGGRLFVWGVFYSEVAVGA